MRYALGVEYTGTHYHGWQRQPQMVSVQACVEAALSQVADHAIEVHVAGRTDAGVHATGQVVHFETHTQRPDKAWVMGVNTHLPQDIRIRWVKAVEDHFHARFSATARRYLYLIDNREVRSAIWPDKATWLYQDLDADAMHIAAQILLGKNDFSAFRAAGCQSKTAMRNVIHCQVQRQDHWVWIDIKANAFLHHMVRNIVGSLFLVGSGERDKRWLIDVFDSKDRTQAGATAPAQGLYLVAVDYPQQYGLPHPESLFNSQLLVTL